MSEMLLLAEPVAIFLAPPDSTFVITPSASHAGRGVATTSSVVLTRSTISRWCSTAAAIAGVGSILPSLTSTGSSVVGDDPEGGVDVAAGGRLDQRRDLVGQPVDVDRHRPPWQGRRRRRRSARRRASSLGRRHPTAATRTQPSPSYSSASLRSYWRSGWARRHRPAGAHRTGAPSPRPESELDAQLVEPHHHRRAVGLEHADVVDVVDDRLARVEADRSSNVRCSVSAAARSAVGPEVVGVERQVGERQPASTTPTPTSSHAPLHVPTGPALAATHSTTPQAIVTWTITDSANSHRT